MQINLFYLRISFKIHKIIGLTFLFVSICLSIKSQQVELINPTFLGNEQRNYYGNNAPAQSLSPRFLDIVVLPLPK